ncbi:MAG: hypothetical protein KA715_09230 [Xanthomonadaceae bacterium]|nr:hypothetical protein [Xanthomonadaceae bacterium]
MKVALNPETLIALDHVRGQIKNKNEFSGKKISPLVNTLLVDACKALSEADFDRLSKRLVSQSHRKKLLTRRAERLVELYGEEYISQLEHRAERKKNNANKINENTA